MDSLTIKLVEMMCYNKKLSQNLAIYTISKVWLYGGGHLGRHLEQCEMLNDASWTSFRF